MLPFYFCLPQMRLVIKSRKKTGTMQKGLVQCKKDEKTWSVLGKAISDESGVAVDVKSQDKVKLVRLR